MKTVLMTICAALLWLAPASAQTGYHLADSVKLGGEGGWDYLTVDAPAGRLYVSRGMRVQVVDLKKRVVAGGIAPTPGVHGIALDRARGTGYSSNGRDSTVTIFDLATLAVRGVIHVGARNPDAILFDESASRLFTFNGGSANAAAIDIATNGVIGYVALPGKPEFAVSDGEGIIFVNIEDKNCVVAFDARSLKILHTWTLGEGEEPSGLAIDRPGHRLFSVCSNKKMVVLDSRTGVVLATEPIGEGVDGVAFDPASGAAFSSNGVGTMTAVKLGSSGKYDATETIVTHRGARTVAIDDSRHEMYVLGAQYGQPPAPTPERPRPRPPIEPGSVTLYILAR